MNVDQLMAFVVDCAEVLDVAGLPDEGRWLVIPQWFCQTPLVPVYIDRFVICVVADESLVHEDCAIFGRANRVFSKRVTA